MLNKILKPLVPFLLENNRLERIWIFAKIDFQKRYYNSYLGLLWALINPLFQMTLFYFVFTVLFGNKIENFALYLFLGLISWMFFSEVTKKGISLLRAKRYLIESMSFQKRDLFISTTFSSLFGFIFNFSAFLVMSIIMGVGLFNIFSLWVPVLIFNLFLIAYGVALLLGTISIYLNDITHVWDMVTLAGFWSVPIFWDQERLFTSQAGILLFINPITGIVVNLRTVLLFQQSPDIYWLVYDFIFTFLFLAISTGLFDRFSHKAAEKI